MIWVATAGGVDQGLTPLRTLTRDQVRDIDRRAVDEYGMTGLVLMENAGRGVADTLCSLGIAGRVVVCCGKGNNAGDGFVIARHLDLRGYDVRTLVFTDPAELRGDAAANFEILQRGGLAWTQIDVAHDVAAIDRELRGAAWLVDALLGTGTQGDPRPPFSTVIERMNAAGAPNLAVDLPSGLDCDSGVGSSCTIRAAHTCTFVAAKPGLLSPHAQQYVGQLHIVDIGIPRKLIDEVAGS